MNAEKVVPFPGLIALEDHPIATPFPLLDGDEFAALVEDIREHGQRVAITLYEGKILDGRNRYRACVELKRMPVIEELPDDIEPECFAMAMNYHRRHLTIDQRAAVWAEMVGAPIGRPSKSLGNQDEKTWSNDHDSELTLQEAADKAKVSKKTMQRAVKRKKEDPEGHAAAKAGKKPAKAKEGTTNVNESKEDPTGDNVIRTPIPPSRQRKGGPTGYDMRVGGSKAKPTVPLAIGEAIQALSLKIEPKHVELTRKHLAEGKLSDQELKLLKDHMRSALDKLLTLYEATQYASATNLYLDGWTKIAKTRSKISNIISVIHLMREFGITEKELVDELRNPETTLEFPTTGGMR